MGGGGGECGGECGGELVVRPFSLLRPFKTLKSLVS